MTQTISNPVLTGFNPDPSILRVGDDYYIATSTFEWFPGVQIHHSRDLVNWRLLTHPLTRVSQLDMRGVGDSCGIWAPCLTHDGSKFHLIYTIMRSRGHFKDSPNFLVTADHIEGPWSEPIYLNCSGFDPSLFHDDDGRKWLVNQLWDPRANVHPFAGIVLQEYDATQQKLVGPVKNIFRGTERKLVEGPHLYKHGGYYHLMTAEGGTQHEHAVTMARSKNIDGPYELSPNTPTLTADGHEHLTLRKAGHASLVQTQDGQWYLAHLCGRPVAPSGRCILGRETAIQKVKWNDDGWLCMNDGGNTPSVQVEAPGLPAHPFPDKPARDDFDSKQLAIDFQTLRVPLDEHTCNLTERTSHLRLRGGESLCSLYYQSHVARRVQHHVCTATTCVDFDPQHFQHRAGLTAYYDTRSFYFLGLTHDESVGRCLTLHGMDADVFHEYAPLVPMPGDDPVHLRLHLNHCDLQFSYSPDGKRWKNIGPALDASILSDEYALELGFTGAYIGLSTQDLAGTQHPADYDYFEYAPVKANIDAAQASHEQTKKPRKTRANA